LSQVLQHLHYFRDLDLSSVGVGVVLSDPVFYLEIFIVGVHCPPGLAYQYGTLLMGNFMVYRIETVFACLNLVRVYLVWRAFADFMLSDLPKRHTLAGFNRVNLGAPFILKRMLHSWAAFFYISILWILTIFVFGYWYRSAELTACQYPPMPKFLGSNITTTLHPGCVTGMQGTLAMPIWLKNKLQSETDGLSM
jgi:hypothetical protein